MASDRLSPAPRARWRALLISLFFGEIFARIKSIATRGGGQVVTDELSASVEGTEYGVRRELPSGSNAPGNVSVFVREGHVLCAPGTRAKWSPVRLAENQSLAVAGYRAPAGARPIDARARSRWADDAEQRLRQSRSPALQPGLSPCGIHTAHSRARYRLAATYHLGSV